ncbi:MAG: FadR/GntR family transcriptional regulator [Pirellulales bacterium]
MKPLLPPRNRTSEVVDRIAGEIRSGRLGAGARLPTEQELMTAMGVSRTVVREAVAALRAEGLVVTRQGLGAFVAVDASRVAFRIASESTPGSDSIGDIVRVLELRLAVEVEAAALAAERASSVQTRRVQAALTAIDAAITRGETAVAEDFAFHRAIADATGNSHFSEFLDFLGRHVIPRQALRAAQGTQDEQRAYLQRIQKDHARVAEAIAARDVAEARRAMRTHLLKSLERYRSLAGQSTHAAASRD